MSVNVHVSRRKVKQVKERTHTKKKTQNKRKKNIRKIVYWKMLEEETIYETRVR